MSKSTLTAALYVRQSVDAPEGIDRQRARCQALIAARGWVSGREFADNDVSASKVRGPSTGWGRMLDAARRGEFDVVVAVNLDRLLRTQRDLSALIESGVKVTTLEGELDLASASGEMQASVLTSMARFEARRKSERQIRANEHRAASGQWVGGRRPFGFERDGMTLRTVEADAVRQGFDDVLNGIPLAAIARSWNGRGLLTGQERQARSGHAGEPSQWTGQTVRFVLTNPRYAGQVRYKGEIQPTPAAWPAVVDHGTFQAVQAILSDPSRRKPGRSVRALLTGIAVCGAPGCGGKVHAGGGARRGVRSYRCGESMGHFARMAEPVDEFVEALVVARLSRSDARDLLLAPRSTDSAALHKEAVGLRERMDALAVAFADGLVSASQLRSGTERMRARLNEVDAALADAGKTDVLGELVAANDVGAIWGSYNIDRKRTVVRALMNVTLHGPGRGTRTFRPETVGIEWIASN
ncbi:recombinase family protein [uncultured Microbacterium sp.]|uniref:recombinase family protein n=1 Tax=uncultured Microbacterium sp. TaxID=191216 RepID=UPI0025E0A38B|nr:recombinase family protein [uncultured Microbacterium sp.]